MTPLADIAGGLLLALSFALLWQRRVEALLLVLALQGAAVAAAATGQGAWLVALAELAWCAAALPWLLRRARLSPAAPWPRPIRPGVLAGAVALAAVALPFGAVGPGLAAALLGALFAAAQPEPMLQPIGLTALQAGAVLAGLAGGGGFGLLVALGLPALGLGVTGFYRPLQDWAAKRAQPRRRGHKSRDARHLSWPWAATDFAGCAALLALSLALPWIGGAIPGPWRIDPVGILAAVLFSAVGCALHWPTPRRQARPRNGFILTLGGLIAALAATPALGWLGLALATAAAATGIPGRRRRLACLGLGLVLCGSLTLPNAALPACALTLTGLACLGATTGELAMLAALLLLRLRGALAMGPPLETLLTAAGLLALLAAIAGAVAGEGDRRTAEHAMLGQMGVALVAFGVGGAAANQAAVLQIVLLVLTRLALELAPAEGLARSAALAGLAGLPPFGVFPGLALTLPAVATRSVPVLLPLLFGVALLGWLLLRGRCPGSRAPRPEIAWLPLALALLLGFAMPGPLAAGLRLAAGQMP